MSEDLEVIGWIAALVPCQEFFDWNFEPHLVAKLMQSFKWRFR